MIKFEPVSRFGDALIDLPTRATQYSAGYDMYVAEDVVVPPIDFFRTKIQDKIFEKQGSKSQDYFGFLNPLTLDEMADLTKQLKCKATLVSTGVKCYMDDRMYLKIVARSSLPLKHWLIVANSEGIIDKDYADNPDNEGEIFFQLFNLSPFAIQLKKGDKIGQGIFCYYGLTDDDSATGERTGGLGSTDAPPQVFIPSVWREPIQPNDWPPAIITCSTGDV